MVFNGEIYGSEHKYRNDVTYSAPAPRLEDAEEVPKRIRERIFAFPKLYQTLVSGTYDYLQTSTPHHGIGVARYSDGEIIIGVINMTGEGEWPKFDLKDALQANGITHENIDSVYYVKEGLKLGSESKDWEDAEPVTVSARSLWNNGISSDHGGPFGCEFIRLRKVEKPLVKLLGKKPLKPAVKDDAAACLWTFYDNKHFPDRSVTRAQLRRERSKREGSKISVEAVDEELLTLMAMGIVEVEIRGKLYLYYLSDKASRAPPQVIDEITKIDEFNRYEHLSPEEIQPVKAKIDRVLDRYLLSRLPIPSPAYPRDADRAFIKIIEDERFIKLFKNAKSIPTKKQVIEAVLSITGLQTELTVSKYDDIIIVSFFDSDHQFRHIMRYAPNEHIDYLTGPRPNPA
ncbi:MAG: hypothetical protein U9Q91_05285, partial [Candidatus Marinimicrobia bacterium]|nr:hypothetical protein [Candidatus Neomarinimicrobiota bacterium]